MRTWEELENACRDCTRCGLCENRKNVVIGAGNRNALIMFIGEGPGEQEDLQGEPFVGPAGQFLDDMLSIIGIDRTNCYIANIVKCRPPKNRDPYDNEQEACIGYLRKQVELVKPQIIVCLGRVAAKRIIGPDFHISQRHGDWLCVDGTWITAIYHPSALLRDVYKRPGTFDDLLSIEEKLKQVRRTTR